MVDLVYNDDVKRPEVCKTLEPLRLTYGVLARHHNPFTSAMYLGQLMPNRLLQERRKRSCRLVNKLRSVGKPKYARIAKLLNKFRSYPSLASASSHFNQRRLPQ